DEQRTYFNVRSRPAHLQLRSVQGTDEGVYRCKVHFKASPSWSQRIALTIEDPPWFPGIRDATSDRRLEGDIGPYGTHVNLRLLCTASGSPPPMLQWGGIGSGLGSPVEQRT
ncbi:unnamed protein product, partial [Meganyctiphanes norvegica]